MASLFFRVPNWANYRTQSAVRGWWRRADPPRPPRSSVYNVARLEPVGVIIFMIFPGTGIQENLAAKGRKFGIPVRKILRAGALPVALDL